MQVSETYNYEKNDHINRADIALVCSQYFGIKDVSPSLYQIAAPVSELSQCNKNGEQILSRDEIKEAIPWNERSMKTFGVVYHFESCASFIGIDGKTYVVPSDKPVLEHLEECGYIIAPRGTNLDGNSWGDDSLIAKKDEEADVFVLFNTIDKNLPPKIVQKIDEMERNRPYYRCHESYASLMRFGGTLGLFVATEEELQQLSLSERKIANIHRYSRVLESQEIEEYVQFALQQYYLNKQNFPDGKKL